MDQFRVDGESTGRGRVRHDHIELAPYWTRRDDAMLSQSSHYQGSRLHGAVIIYDRHSD